MHKKAVIAGATGLVGKQLLDHLIKEDYYEKIYVLSRRALSFDHPKVEVIIINYDDIQTYRNKFSAHHYYCCLGTTFKAAGSIYNLYRIDYVYVYRLGVIAKADESCSQFILLTSVGANSASSIAYNRLKGHIEDEIAKLDIEGIHILRPSILLGHRDKPRLYEELGKVFSNAIKFFLIGSHGEFLAIKADRVAMAMFQIAKSETRGVHTYSPNKMIRLTQKKHP